MALAIAIGGLDKELEDEYPFKGERKGASDDKKQRVKSAGQ